MLREEGGGGVEEGSRATCVENDDVKHLIACGNYTHWLCILTCYSYIG